MFHARAVKLAGLYLAILVVISAFFSLNVYQLSVQEFERGIRRPEPAFRIPPDQEFPTRLREQLLTEREQQFQDAKKHIISRLLFINLIILSGGGILSYYLALRTLKPIEEAHEALERFTADASHELRTPITAMRSENEVALMNPKLTLSEAKRQIKSNIEELEKLTDLSAGLLRLASMKNNGLQKIAVGPQALIDQALSRILSLAEKKQILIQTTLETETVILGDESSLVEALVILLDNAIKYSPKHSEIRLEVIQDHKNIVLKVIDHGIGITATEIPHIFDRFYRADTARSKQQNNGYGLGLAIAKNIADIHQGLIRVDSRPGQGSTFSLILPAKA